MYQKQGYKIVVIGDSCTGKTSLIDRLTNKCFKLGTLPTVGAEFQTHIAILDGEEVKLNIWDTAGQERYKSVTKSYYKNALGIIIVYDITK